MKKIFSILAFVFLSQVAFAQSVTKTQYIGQADNTVQVRNNLRVGALQNETEDSVLKTDEYGNVGQRSIRSLGKALDSLSGKPLNMVSRDDSGDLYVYKAPIKGAIALFNTITERDALSDNLRDTGMLAYVFDSLKTYQLKGGIDNDDWVEFQSGASACAVTFYATDDSSYLVKDSCGTKHYFKYVLDGNGIQGATPSLQQVTNVGSTTSNTIHVNGVSTSYNEYLGINWGDDGEGNNKGGVVLNYSAAHGGASIDVIDNSLLGISISSTGIYNTYNNKLSFPATAGYFATSVNNVTASSSGDISITQLPITEKSTDPTTTDIPTGFSAVFKNTTSGKIFLWVNNGGTLLKVELL